MSGSGPWAASTICSIGRTTQRLFAADVLVRDMCAELGHADDTFRQRVNCRVEAQGTVNLPLDAAVPLSLIVNEVLGNAYKHAFPGERRGEIVISLAESPEERTAGDPGRRRGHG